LKKKEMIPLRESMDINSEFRQGKRKGENRALEEGAPRAPIRLERIRNIQKSGK